MTEEWRQVPGYSQYMASNMGKLKSFRKYRGGKMLACTIGSVGYPVTSAINDSGDLKVVYVHKLIALAFIPNPDNKKYINHKNGIKHDNRAENLEWCTCSENLQHAWDNGLNTGESRSRGSDHYLAKPIYQYATDGSLIKKWEFQSQVTSEGYKQARVSKAAIYRRVYAGCIWSLTELTPAEVISMRTVRLIVVLDYPYSEYKVGQVLEFSAGAQKLARLRKYPHIFIEITD